MALRAAENVCYTPLAWKTYNIDFRAARYSAGKKIKNARLTVHDNGVMIHDNFELCGSTPGAPQSETAEAGPASALQRSRSKILFSQHLDCSHALTIA